MKPIKKRLTFGLLIDWIVGWGDYEYYQSIILEGIESFAKKNDINLICFVTGRVDSPHEWERSRNILFQFVDKYKVDGLIIPTSAIGIYGKSASIKKMMEGYRDIPIVTIGENFDDYHSVTVNNYTGMRQIMDHLIEEHDCRKIAFIKGPADNKEAEIRFNAYIEALLAHGIPFDPDYVYQGNFLLLSGSDAVKAFIERNIKLDALVASNDNMAIGALVEFHRHEGKIPENLPLTGFDDAEDSRSHALTTVRQSIFDESIIACDMLLRLIKGEDVPKEMEVPTEMVIRSSCGCLPQIVKNVKAAMPETCSGDFSNYYETDRYKILAGISEVNSTFNFSETSSEFSELTQYEVRLLDAFYEEFSLDRENKFVNIWNSVIFWAMHKKIAMSFLHDLLSHMRKQILSYIHEQQDMIKAENLFQAARVQINDAVQRTASVLSYSYSLQSESLDLLEENLMSTLECSSQMDLIYETAPKFGVGKGYIALYEDPSNLLEYSRLILGYNEKYRIDTGPDGIRFRTLNLLPQTILSSLYEDRFSIIVQALHQGDNQLGFSVFSFDNKVNKAYEIIRHSLSVALKGTMLVNSIKNQALDLEKQVIKRTLELSQTNEQLINEISKRKSAEEQLKKALKDLEFYNKQLHLQSIRDELTSLYNRRGFMALGSEYLLNAKRSGHGFILIFADMDGLKQINDKYGHKEGDYALVKTAEVLNQAFRSTDIIARLGGDEFTVLVASATFEDEAEIINRLKYYIDLYNQASDKPYDLSMSVGTAYYDPLSDSNLDDLLNAADLKLYDEKQQKKKSLGS